MALWLLCVIGVALLAVALLAILAVLVPDSRLQAAGYRTVPPQEADEPAASAAAPVPAPAPVVAVPVVVEAAAEGVEAADVVEAAEGVEPAEVVEAAEAAAGAGDRKGEDRELGGMRTGEMEISAGNAGRGEDGGAAPHAPPSRRLVLKIVMASAPGAGGRDGGGRDRAAGVVFQLETDGGEGSSGNVVLAGGDSGRQELGGGTGGASGAGKGAGDGRKDGVQVSGSSQGSAAGGLNSGFPDGCPRVRTVIINGVEIDEAGLQRLIASLPGTSSISEVVTPAADGNGDKAVKVVVQGGVSDEVLDIGAVMSTPVAVLEGDVTSEVGLGEGAQGSDLQVVTVEMGSQESALVFPGLGEGTSTLTAGDEQLSLFDVASDGLGSLRILPPDSGADVKPGKDPPEPDSADFAAALAALNLDSIEGNVSNITPEQTSVSSGPDVPSVTIPVGNNAVKLVLNASEEGSGSERGNEELDEHNALLDKGGDEDDDLDAKRRERKKKKNRGRRQKAKSANALAAAAAEIERKVIEKLTAEHVRALAEIEVGCSCRTVKGGAHTISCPYPFTSSGSMVQRKIKEQYDELVRSNAGRTLTLAQVGRFTTCLVEAKTALQQKSETIQRRFTIAKSLLAKADKSSFDRLCGQIYGLEIEQKKLEEDTIVYNRLQEQLKLSPAYQKMLEYGRTHFEMHSTGRLVEKQKPDSNDISFEELLAQEKKDSFWQKHSPAQASVPVVGT